MTFRYRYRALTAAGAAIDGSIEADDRRTAQRLLRERGLTPLDLVGADAPAKTGISRRTLRRDDSTGLLRELHALLAGGVPAGEALGLISDSHQDSAHSQAAAAILAQLRTGEPLSAALRQVLPRLDPSVHAVVTAGEATGDLTEALGDAIVQLDADRVARDVAGSKRGPSLDQPDRNWRRHGVEGARPSDLSGAVGSDECGGSNCAQTGLAGLADPGALAKRTRSGGVVRKHGAAAAPPD